jgi:hypothetical protein
MAPILTPKRGMGMRMPVSLILYHNALFSENGICY